jgi:hypothetical protein
MRRLEDKMAQSVETMCRLEDKMRHSVDKTTQPKVEASRRRSFLPRAHLATRWIAARFPWTRVSPLTWKWACGSPAPSRLRGPRR